MLSRRNILATAATAAMSAATARAATFGNPDQPAEGADTYKPVPWDDAFARVGEVLRGLPDPNMAEFYTSGRADRKAHV